MTLSSDGRSENTLTSLAFLFQVDLLRVPNVSSMNASRSGLNDADISYSCPQREECGMHRRELSDLALVPCQQPRMGTICSQVSRAFESDQGTGRPVRRRTVWQPKW